MKKYIISTILIAMLLIANKAKSQNVSNTDIKRTHIPVLPPCEEYKVIGKNPIKRRAMIEAVNFFVGTDCFTNNRGILKLYISSNEQGNEVWSVYSTIEDQHMWGYSITPFFEDFDGDIVLIYKPDYRKINKEMSEEERQKIRTCTDQIIGDRVYQRPTREDRWTNEYQGPNVPNPRGTERIIRGTDCKIRFIFNDDGTDYTKKVKEFY